MLKTIIVSAIKIEETYLTAYNTGKLYRGVYTRHNNLKNSKQLSTKTILR